MLRTIVERERVALQLSLLNQGWLKVKLYLSKRNCGQILKRLNFQILAHSEYKSDKRALVNVLIKHKKTSTNNPKFTIKQHRKIK